MRSGDVGFIALALVATFLLGTRFPEIFHSPRHRSNVEEQVQLLNLQRMCADQADKSFKLEGFQPKADVINSYTAHYNGKLGKCFILTSTYDASQTVGKGTVSTFQSLDDAFEGTNYGNYFDVHDTKGPPPGTDRYVTCYLEPPGGKRQVCHSEAQWNAMVYRYMRENLHQP
ncbi:MAG: hypothetical protein ACTHPD_15060 [Rhizomicrobium sp.]